MVYFSDKQKSTATSTTFITNLPIFGDAELVFYLSLDTQYAFSLIFKHMLLTIFRNLTHLVELGFIG